MRAEPVKSPERHFLHRLESLRGIAALMVAGHHAFFVLDGTNWQAAVIQGVRILANGRAAVTLFFVLSGLVLGLSISRASGAFVPEFLRFAVRRVCRIYPAYVVSTALILLYWVVYFVRSGPSLHAAGGTFEHFWRLSLTPWLLAKNFLFLDQSLNFVTWTLKVEMVGSLSLPFLHFVSTRLNPAGRGLLMLALLVLTFLHGSGPSRECLFMFYLGYLLPQVGPVVFGRLRPSYLMLLGGAAVFLGAHLLANTEMARKAGLVVEAFSASALLGSLLYSGELRPYRSLDHSITRFYGRISYSFYLVHPFALDVLWRLFIHAHGATILTLYPVIARLGLWFFSSALATPLAWSLYQWVERPGIAFGKRVCERPVTRQMVPEADAGLNPP